MMESGSGAATTGLTSYDDSALCSGAFRILRSMVNGWLRDVSQFQNVFADIQIIHLYRLDLKIRVNYIVSKRKK